MANRKPTARDCSAEQHLGADEEDHTHLLRHQLPSPNDERMLAGSANRCFYHRDAAEGGTSGQEVRLLALLLVHNLPNLKDVVFRRH